MNTKHYTPADAEAAARVIADGGLLGIPTETVYGLGADGLNEAAVKSIFIAKGRPQDNPLILHIPSHHWLERYCQDIPASAYDLADRFWPGPLTMILKRRPIVPDVVTAGLDSVGMRCPACAVTRDIIARADVPVAAPSGNLSGKPSPTSAAAMLEDMEGRIDAIVDAGPCQVGVESTIIDLTTTPPRLLRPGGVTLEELEDALGEVAVDEAVRRLMAPGERPRAPGMKYRHYAPKAPVAVVKGSPDDTSAYIAEHLGQGSGVICFDEFQDRFAGHPVRAIGPAADQAAQARHIFEALRSFDHEAVTEIWAQSPLDSGLGLAVTNRLNKAAGFHIIEVPSAAPFRVIGITSPTGAGKTTALNALDELGALILDADAVYHELLHSDAALRKSLTDAFGDRILDPETGLVDRKRLADAVYPDGLEQLNQLTHPAVIRELDRRIELAKEQGRPAAAIDAINLIQSGVSKRCDWTVSVLAPAEVRIRRIMARDQVDEDYARRRVEAQPKDEFYIENSDFVLENDGNREPDVFRAYTKGLFEGLLSRS